MLNKGILEIDNNNVMHVRVLELHGAKGQAGRTPTIDLPTVLIATQGQVDELYTDGDTVIIEYEKEDTSKPVVIGSFGTKKKLGRYKVASIESFEKAALPKQTTIGNVTSKEIAMLTGVNANVQIQISKLKETIEEQANEIKGLRKDVSKIATYIKTHRLGEDGEEGVK